MKMWDGRFSKPSAKDLEVLNNSLPVDKRLIEEDIAGSIAWAGALRQCRVLTDSEYNEIAQGLKAIADDHARGEVSFQSSDEDIHMAVERMLVDKIGEAGKKIHTGRSRNDQVATDVRLFLKKQYAVLGGEITDLQRALLKRARSDKTAIMPGYTHLQQAQPILLSHYWLSLLFALEREKRRLANAASLADEMPLGSGALAGTAFSVDRTTLASELGFGSICANSIDAVASRDFVLDALACCASLAVLLSRYSEDLIIWSSREFNFIELDDAWSTGSSMMPQKKNPDSLELLRSKAGRCIGNFAGFAATLKGVSLAYCKDLQEDKEPLWDSIDTMRLACRVLRGVVETLTVKAQSMKAGLDPFLLATDVADYLAAKGMPFRRAHKVVGAIVARCIERKMDFQKLTVKQLKEFSELFQPDVAAVFTWEHAIAHRDVAGGTGPNSVARQIELAAKLVG